MCRILAADIGGTHSRFAVFRAEVEDRDRPLLFLEREQWLAGHEYPGFRDALGALAKAGKDGEAPLLDKASPRPDMAVLAPAGPVRGEFCALSNLDWVVRAQDVRELLGVEQVRLINDFAAQAYACLLPDDVDAVEILPGEPRENAPVAVLGAGTGLGKALLLPDGPLRVTAKETRADMLRRFARARVLATEGGHEEFPFVGRREFAFAEFAAARAGTERLIGDAIVTGSGLAHIFAYVTGRDLPPPEATAEAAEYPEVLEWYARFYARACRNFVLDTLALGGLFITGGMALRLPVLTHPAFAGEFHESAHQRSLLERVPVWHVRKAQAGLWGAALYGLLQLAG